MVSLTATVALPLRAPRAQLLQPAQYCPPRPLALYSNCMFQQQQQERLRGLQREQQIEQLRKQQLRAQQQLEQLREQQLCHGSVC